MKLKVKDQIHISSVRADTLAPGELVDVNDALAKELLKAHPNSLEAVEEKKVEGSASDKSASADAAKSEPAPANKAESPPANKAVRRAPRTKAKKT